MENNDASNSSTNTNNSNSNTPTKDTSFSDLAKLIRFPDKLVPQSTKVNLLKSYSLSEILKLNKPDNIIDTDELIKQIPTIDYITDKAGAIVAEYFAAFSLGALLGASITTGLLFGTFFCYTSFRNNYLSSFSYYCKKILSFPFRNRIQKNVETSNGTNNGNMKTDNNIVSSPTSCDSNSSNGNDVCIIPSSKSIIIINEIASLSSSFLNNNNTPKVNIRSNIKHICIKNCLDNLSIKLSKNNLNWNNVIKITAYLVVIGNECTQPYSSIDFRSFLNEYIPDHKNNNMMINIIFVQYLENEAIMQIELFAAS